MNRVIAGDYINGVVLNEFDKLVISNTKEKAVVNAKTVKSFEVLTEDNQKSLSSGVARGLVGGALLGGVGMVAGAATAKTTGTYQVSVEFVDGKKSLLQLDTKAYQALTKVCFGCGNATLEEAQAENEKYNKKKNKGCLTVAIIFIIALILFVAVIAWISSL